jgi:hypothetical protein
MNRYYAKCSYVNCYGEDDVIPLIVDAKSKKEAKIKIHEKYHIGSIVEFTNVKPIHRYDFNGKRIG